MHDEKSRDVGADAPTRFVVEAKVISDHVVWPKWATEAVEELFGPSMYRCDWPGSQWIIHAIAEAYAKQQELAAVS